MAAEANTALEVGTSAQSCFTATFLTDTQYTQTWPD